MADFLPIPSEFGQKRSSQRQGFLKLLLLSNCFFALHSSCGPKTYPQKNFLITTNFVKNTAASTLTFYFESKY